MKKLAIGICLLIVACSSSGSGGGEDDFILVSQECVWTDQSGSYWDYAWKVVITNNTSEAVRGYLEMKLFNAEGFVLAADRTYTTLTANKTTSIYGQGMISATLATQVTHYGIGDSPSGARINGVKYTMED